MSKKTKYFLRDEVVIHNHAKDIWVIINRHVFNLTPLYADRRGSMNDYLRLLTQYAGKDISCFFNKAGTPLTKISHRGIEIPVLPSVCETTNSNFFRTKGCSWWEDPMYKIGKVSKQERFIRIINTLTNQKHTLKICEEDTINDIIKKYYRYNAHTGSYSWRKYARGSKVSGRLSLDRTLTENGILYEPIGPCPALWLYYNDDLTIA